MRHSFAAGLLCCWLPVLASAELSDLVVDISPDQTLVLREVPDADIRIDGRLSEAVWAELPAWDEFVVLEPDTLAQPEFPTRVRIFYTAKGLYVGVDMDQPRETLVKWLSGRDRRDINRDQVGVTLDTSGEGRYGYWFSVYLGDSLSDGTLLPERNFSREWDGAWRGASEVTDTGWSAELFIPWGTVAMPSVDGSRNIGLYMSRKVASRDERYGWPALPRTKPQFISKLQQIAVDGVNPKQQFSIYPFVVVGDDRFDGQVRYRSGADFFWRPSSDFQLTATLNPDFGAVESDDVVINLSATETFFPEKRLFFVEGQEIFVTSPRADTRGGGVGNQGAPTTLINTRRIGGRPLAPALPPGVAVSDRELAQPVDLQGAVKMTGQSGRFRYGVLAAFEDDHKFDATLNGEPFHLEAETSDYGVARVLFEDAPGGSYKALGMISTAVLNENRDAMTHGIDAHYLGADGKWKIDGQLYMSDIEDAETGYGGFLDFEYTYRQGMVQGLGIEYIDEHADLNDLGFLQRNDNFRVRSRFTWTNSDLKRARDNEFDVRGFVQKNDDDLFTGGGLFIANQLTLNDYSRFMVRINHFYESYDDLNGFGNGTYRIEERSFLGMSWDSDSSRALRYGIGMGIQEEELGGDSYIGRASVTWRPSDRFALSLHARYMDRDGWLLHQEDRNMTSFQAQQWTPKVSAEYFLSARQQIRFSLQWVGIKAKEDKFFMIPTKPGELIEVAKPAGPSDSFSLSQMSMQLRYRWEIAPLSDIYLVYTRLVDQGSPYKSFSDTFSDGYDNPVGNLLVFKLRYRFGS